MKSRIKILIIILISIFIADFANNNVFLSNSPKINPFFVSDFSQKIRTKINNVASIFKKSNNIAQQKNNTPQRFPSANEILTNAVLNQTSKGVYAGQYEGTQVYRYVENEITWVSYTFTLKNGQQVTIKVPEGADPPPQAVIEAAYQ